MMKRTKLFLFILLSVFYFHSSSALASTKNNLKVPVPIPVKVTVANANWVETISICNVTANPIPLKNISFDFNYAITMPTNIWGNPWVAWKVASQNGTQVKLVGGTEWSPPLQPDPNCTNPLTIQFNAAPDAPAPTGPFIFSADGAQPSGQGSLTINLGNAPAANLPNPTIKVTGLNTNQEKVVTWGSNWSLTNLTAGSYDIISSPVDNGTNFYVADKITTTVSDQQTTTANVIYKTVAMGTVKVTLVSPPTTQVAINFVGNKYNLTKSVSNGGSIMLPADTYTVNANVPGSTATITPNPITVPGATTMTVTYSSTSNSGGPYTTINGQIVDKDKKAITFQGVNWFGFNTDNHVLHGLWTADFETMLSQIKSLGFNAVRIPFQFDFILNPSIKPSGITTFCDGKPCNTNIPQDSALNAFQYIVKRFTDSGLYVMLDDHYEDKLYLTNQAQWISGWQKVAQLFIDNPSVGYDIYNEPDSQGLAWETGTTPWSKGLTSAANAIYSVDKNKLIFVEGVAQGTLESNWGDGFATDDDAVNRGVSNPRNYFKQLLNQPYLNQIVISPHVYGPDGTNNQGPDHSDQAKAFAAWSRLHGYLFNNFSNVNNTSQSGFCNNGNCHLFAVAYGEFGGKFDPADPYYQKDTATLINLAKFINQLGIGKSALPSWFYWDWNPNSGNTGGILKDDWKTIDCNKVNYLKANLALKPAAGFCS